MGINSRIDHDTMSSLLEAISRFVREQLIPAEAEVAENDSIPPALVEQMRNLGLFGLSIPPEFGGLGLSMRDEVEVMFELGRASPAFRSTIGTNVGIGSQGILIDGTDAQKARYLPGLASGALVGCFALTEPDAGSDIRSIRTTARRDGSGYRINGTKRFITNGPHAGLITLVARTPEENNPEGVSLFLIDGDTKGLTRGKPDKKMGQQGAHICDLIFEDCWVPEEAVLGGMVGRGLETVHKVLTRGRLHIASVCVGIAERLIEESVAYASSRRQFGNTIGNFQLVQAMLADSRTECYAARCMVVDAAEKFDRGAAPSLAGSCSKLFASEMVGRVADRAVQVFGGAGYVADYGIERFYRDVRLFRIYEGTSEIQRLIIGRQMMKAS